MKPLQACYSNSEWRLFKEILNLRKPSRDRGNWWWFARSLSSLNVEATVWNTKWQQSHFKVLNSSSALSSLQKALFFFNDFIATFSGCLNIHASFFFILFPNTFLCKPKSQCCRSTIIQQTSSSWGSQLLFFVAPPCSREGDQTLASRAVSQCSVQAVNRRWSLVPGLLMNWPVWCEAAGRSHCPAGAHQTGPPSCRLDTGGWTPTGDSNIPFITNAKTVLH